MPLYSVQNGATSSTAALVALNGVPLSLVTAAGDTLYATGSGAGLDIASGLQWLG